MHLEGGTSSLEKLLLVDGKSCLHSCLPNYGDHHWLVDGTPHCNIRRDFVNTKHGIAPRPIINIDM
jgi:hypothetical protein